VGSSPTGVIRKENEMKYPNSDEVELANHRQLGVWMRFLPSPGANHIGEAVFRDKMLEESTVLNMISDRFESFGGWSPEISKSVELD